jgi:hypothetical protein
MTNQDTLNQNSSLQFSPQWNPESPFLNEPGPAESESSEFPEKETPGLWSEFESPFLSLFEFPEGESADKPEVAAIAVFMAELKDEEFDQAVIGLINEASDLYQTRITSEYAFPGGGNSSNEQILEAYFQPLVREAGTLMENIGQGTAKYDFNSMTEAEVDRFFEQYEPRETQLGPSFEYFLKKLWNKAKTVVKGAVNLAKKGIKFIGKLSPLAILSKLKQLIKPLIQRVLKFAINKLPPALQPVAMQIGKRLGIIQTEYEQLPEDREEAATPDIASIQNEFDVQIANLLLPGDQAEQEMGMAQYVTQSEKPYADSINELDRARSLFIKQLGELKEGQDPTPLLENFIPAILPVLKLGLTLIGRPKVVKFLANFLSKWIAKIADPRVAPALSQAIVDAGLRLISLETTPQDEAETARGAIATTVEETVRQISALPDYILENDQLLESSVLEAFETAAASNLPQILPEKSYLERPELRETTGNTGTWALIPTRKNYYKKYTRIFETVIAPETARNTRSFGGEVLADFLRNYHGLAPGASIKTRIHLYEAIPGTWLSRISKNEKNVRGLGSAAKSAWSQIHPLTIEAAGMLIQQPGLGRTVSERFLQSRHRIAVGQRFYYLEIAGSAVPAATAATSGAPMGAAIASGVAGRVPMASGQVNLVLDFPSNEIRLYIYVCERDAQNISVKLRKSANIGTIWTILKSCYEGALKAQLSGKISDHVKIIHENVMPEQFNALAALGKLGAQALQAVAPIVLEKLREKLLEWIGMCLSEYFKQRSEEFIKATEDPADGVTIIIKFINPPGISIIGKVLKGEPAYLLGNWFPQGTPGADTKVVSGFARVR